MEPSPKKRLGEMLVEAGIIDEHQLRAALGHQRQWGGKLGQALVDLKLASEPQIVSALSTKLGYEIVHLDALQRTASLDAALKLIPRDAARRANALPLAADVSSLTVAMSDPSNMAVSDDISFRTGRRVKIVLAGDREVARAVRRLYFPEEDRESRSLDLERGKSSAPLNRSYEALTDHVQQHYFRSSLREIEGEAAATPTPPPPDASGETQPPEVPPAPVASAPPAVPPTSVPMPRPTAPPASHEAALRDALDRMALGEESPGGLKGSRLAAAAVKALLRRGLVTEADLLAELTQPNRR
jgi:hypothetical protein